MTQEQRDKNWKYFRLLGWVLFLIMLFLRGCGNSETVKPPPKKGSFKTDTIHHTTLGKVKTKYVKGEPYVVYKNNEINKELAEENYKLQIAYINTLDSVEKLKMYIDAITYKKFSKTFENDNFKANVKGISQGEVKELALDYELKKIPLKEVRFRILGGVNINPYAVGLNLGFQNRKGNIIELGYDTEKRINIGYKQTIFKIVK